MSKAKRRSKGPEQTNNELLKEKIRKALEDIEFKRSELDDAEQQLNEALEEIQDAESKLHDAQLTFESISGELDLE